MFALLASACNQTAGDECTDDTTCSVGLVCEAGTCVEGVDCTDNAACGEGEICGAGGTCVSVENDQDGDGVADDADNCPAVSNPDQVDTDEDGTGDACEDIVAPGDCADSSECALDEVCVEGLCELVECSLAASDTLCPADAICVGTICRFAPDCSSDAQCADTLGVCGDDGTCVPGCQTNAECGGRRTTACTDNVCVYACSSNAQCDDDETCTGGFCLQNECSGTGIEGCPDGERCDGSGQCEAYTACGEDVDCLESEFCDAGICEPSVSCLSDLNCSVGQICESGFCRTAATCDDDSNCLDSEDCVGGLCVPFLCRGNADCAPQVCESGACIDAPDVTIGSVIILTRPDVLSPGNTLSFTAIALDADGSAVPGVVFTWTSSDTGVGTFSGATFTAGATAGTSEIVASAGGIDSVAVVVVNVGESTDTRVAVVDGETGVPIAGATVLTSEGEFETNADGVATLGEFAGDVHVFAEGFDYASFIDVAAGMTVLAPISEATGFAAVGGFTGEMDYSAVSSSGDASIGLAGSALPGNLVDLNLANLLGDPVNTAISVPGLGGQEFPLPGGLVIRVDFFGIGDVKGTYFARSPDGLNFAWGLAGKVNVQSLISLFTGGGGTDLPAILGAILPLFESFDHGLQVFDSDSRALIVDADDFDGDGNASELVPDYSAFPEIDLAPGVAQRYRTEVLLPALPTINGEPTEVAVLVGGVIVDGVGFVPTGISAAQASAGEAPPAVILRMAPSHSGLGVGEFAVVAIAFGSEGAGFGAEGLELPSDISVRMFAGDRLPEAINFATTPFPTVGEFNWSAETRAFTGGAPDSALARITLVGPSGSWSVYQAGDADLGFTLPSPPNALDDWSVDSIVRVDGVHMDGADYAEVIGAGGVTLRSMDQVATGFARAEAR